MIHFLNKNDTFFDCESNKLINMFQNIIFAGFDDVIEFTNIYVRFLVKNLLQNTNLTFELFFIHK